MNKDQMLRAIANAVGDYLLRTMKGRKYDAAITTITADNVTVEVVDWTDARISIGFLDDPEYEVCGDFVVVEMKAT